MGLTRVPPVGRAWTRARVRVLGALLLVGPSWGIGVLPGGPVAVSAQSQVTPGTVNEWQVVSSRVDVVLDESGDGADVHVRYVLNGTSGDFPDVPIDVGILQFAGTSVPDVEVTGLRRGIVLWETVGSQRSASFLPALDSIVDGGVPVHMRYRVQGAVRGTGARRTVRVPIVSAPPPSEAVPGGFVVEIAVPVGWAVSEPFPSGLRANAATSYTASLPVTPAMVGFRARTDGAWRPGFLHLVDLTTLLVLLVFGGFGWRHMKRAAA